VHATLLCDANILDSVNYSQETAVMGSRADRRVEEIRRFNRFYTRRIGVLGRGLLGSDLSLTEVRVLYELAHSHAPTASELARDLDLDPGYLSRILARFERAGYLTREPTAADARRSLLSMTAAGRKVFEPLDAAAHDQVRAMIAGIPAAGQRRLITAMRDIESLLGTQRDAHDVVLRDPAPGDFGWVIERHGVLYAQEYGWGERFEALVADVVARFMASRDPDRERCWIADFNGEPVGSVFLVAKSKRIAKLRLLIVEPEARGLGIGSRLVQVCLAFAREASYRTVELWTQSVLHAARRIYERSGFELIAHETHTTFGPEVMGQTWRLNL
jgi:DNA-binding MarR family transcriptional regulator/predicted N-acetyltransferase YhbS